MQLTFQGFLPFSEGHPAHQSLTAQLKKKWTLNLELKAEPKMISEIGQFELGSWIGDSRVPHFFPQK
jgi:hypothetical protein